MSHKICINLYRISIWKIMVLICNCYCYYVIEGSSWPCITIARLSIFIKLSLCKDVFFLEGRSGILKPQGSLEKAKEEREMFANFDRIRNRELNDTSATEGFSNLNRNYDVAKFKRAKQNVALQSIYKKIEENKQVRNKWHVQYFWEKYNITFKTSNIIIGFPFRF